MSHWIYDANAALAQVGFTQALIGGSGRRVYTWRQFAEAATSIALLLERLGAVGLSEQQEKLLSGSTRKALERTIAELAPEMAELGFDRSRQTEVLGRLRKLVTDNRPTGVQAPLVSGECRFLPREWEAGVALARSELSRGEVVLYTTRQPIRWDLNMGLALPLNYEREPNDPYAHRERIAGHNAEVWRYLREKGSPSLAWTRDLFHLPATWKRLRKSSVQLNRKQSSVEVPGSSVRLKWQVALSDRSDWRDLMPAKRKLTSDERCRIHRLIITDGGPNEASLFVPALSEATRRLRVVWGAPGTGVVYLRVPVPRDRGKPYRLYAYDLHTGQMLNAAADE